MQLWPNSGAIASVVLMLVAVDGRGDPRFPGNDARYAHVLPEQLPLTESLQLTVQRVLPFWTDTIVPALQSGKNVIVVAHGNSLRVCCKIMVL